VIASGGLIGSVETMLAGPNAAVSVTSAGHVAVGAKDSFAEVMRQSTQIDAAKSKAKTSDVKEKKQPSDDVDALNNEESESSAKDAVAKPETKVLSKSADVSAESEAANVAKTVAPTIRAAPLKAAANDVLITTIEKLPVEEREKTKPFIAAKASSHPVVKNAQSSTISAANDGGMDMVAPVANVVIDGAATSSTKQITIASSAVASTAIATVAADDKSAKGKTSQIGATSGAESVTAAVANLTDAATVPNASIGNGGVVSGSQGSSVGAVAAAALQDVVGQITGVSSVQVHSVQIQGANPLPASVVAHSVQVGAVVAHSQTSGSSDLTLSTYDAGKPNQLEVGLQSGGLGWLKVRAELTNTGEVNAYLRGSSTDSTGLLQMQAPKIEAYLGTQDVAVHSVQVEAAQLHTPGTGVGGYGSAASDSRSPQQQSKRSNRGSDAGADELTSMDAINEEVMPSQLVIRKSGITMAGTGNWLSVRA